MSKIKIANRGPQRFWMVERFFIPIGQSISVSKEVAARITRNALELQKDTPTPHGFRVANLPDGNVAFINTTEGAMARDLDFRVPLVLLKGTQNRYNPVETEVDESALSALFENKAAREAFLSLRGQEVGLMFTLPNTAPFNTFAGV